MDQEKIKMSENILKYPFVKPDNYRITQKFGADFIYRAKIVKHKGVDWALPKGTLLLAPFDGVISRVEKSRGTGYGRSVYIHYQSNLISFEVLLAHCDSIDINKGETIKCGQIIAKSGRSGFWRGKNGYHVHLGLKKNGQYVDPLPYLGVDDRQTSLFSEPKRNQCNHTVQEGETLWKIAQAFYGSGKYYNEIFLANSDKIKNPREIKPGQILKIPELNDRGV